MATDTGDLDAVEVLDHLIQRAVTAKASDIHIEPRREGIRVRFRVDGVMISQGRLPLELAPSLTTRIKVLARMDMTVRRLPQDGQFSLELEGVSLVHLRASTFPGIHGETLVLRLLMGHNLIPLEQLGIGAESAKSIMKLANAPSGLILVCGPTGSGKTSTLYSILRELDTTRLSVVTLEDPIEVEFADITQGQANPRQGFTFAAGLRAILRQDPDVIMVGEMRDSETAQIALQASLTGHLVLSTLHTSDVVETILRLVDLGVEPWIVANSLLAVVAQRLVRVLCPQCARPEPVSEAVMGPEGDVLIPAGTTIHHAVGCKHCHETGYRGRTGVFELMELNDDVRDLIKARATKRAYRAAVREGGMVPLRQLGIQKVLDGTTTLDEVQRVTL